MKEKDCNFAFGNQRRAPLYERQALFIRKAHQATQVLHARMLRTLSLEGSKTVRQPYKSRLTPLFYQKTLKRARKSDVDNIGVCGKRTLSLEGSKTVRQPFGADTHFLLHARMLRTLSLEGKCYI